MNELTKPQIRKYKTDRARMFNSNYNNNAV